MLDAPSEDDRHHSVLHPGPAPWSNKTLKLTHGHGREDESVGPNVVVTSKCTEVCGGDTAGRSCSKICLVRVFPTGQRDKAIELYTVLDEQSNRSLVRSEFFELFNVKGVRSPYSLRTCAGVVEKSGRRAHGFQVQSLDEEVTLSLPTLIECKQIPNNRSEIPTPQVAVQHNHLKCIAKQIPNLHPQAPIMLLLGRDLIIVHKVRKQINGPHDSPYEQNLDLGWVIVGSVCLGKVHKPDTVNTFYTNTLENGRTSQNCTFI